MKRQRRKENRRCKKKEVRHQNGGAELTRSELNKKILQNDEVVSSRQAWKLSKRSKGSSQRPCTPKERFKHNEKHIGQCGSETAGKTGGNEPESLH